MEKAAGALCDKCPFRHNKFCPPAPSSAPTKFVVIGESPGNVEVDVQVPLVGPSGRKFDHGLKLAGLSRNTAHITNTVLCRPPKGVTKDQWAEAASCCAPRLARELERKRGLPSIVFGSIALDAICEKRNITDWFGYPLASSFMGADAFPIFHPAFALRSPALWPVFWDMMRRAGLYVRGGLVRQTWPRMLIHAGADMIAALRWIHENEKTIAVDIENVGDPIYADILNVGMGCDSLGISVTYADNACPNPEVFTLLRDILASTSHEFVFHNAQHDVLGLGAHELPVLGTVVDTMSMHQALWPQLPHGLGFACAQYLVLERWKSEFHENSEERGAAVFTHAAPETRALYNAKDCVGDYRLLRALQKDLGAAEPRIQARYKQLTELAPICTDMRRKGLPISRVRKDYYAEKLAQSAALAAAAFQEAAPFGYTVQKTKTTKKAGTVTLTAFEPYILGAAGQTRSLKHLFFAHFGLAPLRHSKKTGAAALDTWSLTMYAARNPGTQIADCALATIRYRKATKLKSTYCDGLHVDPDGYVRSNWKSGGTTTGRLASGDPNLQNVPKKIRAMFGAPPGYILVAADGEQVELRLTAIQADDKPLLDAFARGEKVHLKNARDLFGDPKITKSDKRYTRAKNMVYGLDYGGTAKTVWETCVKDDPTLRLEQVEIAMRRWFELHPAIKGLHARLMREAEAAGKTVAPIGHCAYTYHDGVVDRNVCFNFGTQAASAFIVARAMVVLAAAGYDIRINVHDELVLLAPINDWKPVARALKKALEIPVEINGKMWVLPAQVSVGIRWGSGMRDVENKELEEVDNEA